MSCPTCALHRGGFASEAEYMSFRRALSAGVEAGHLTKSPNEPSKGPFLKSLYSCNRCGACWVLSAPDQSYRGAWEEVACK
jgi:hypothetical protein